MLSMHRTFPSNNHAALRGSRLSTVTRWSSASSARTRRCPINPVAPVTRMFSALSPKRISGRLSSFIAVTPNCIAAKPSRTPDKPTPMPHTARKTLSKPCGCQTKAVGCASHSGVFNPSSITNAPPFMASTVCVILSLAGSRRVLSSTTKSHKVRIISTPNTASKTRAQAPCHVQVDKPMNKAL